MRIQKALIEGTISTKTAGLLLYSMQLALQNVGQTTFGQAKTEEAVRETVSEGEAVRQDLFTAEDTEGTEEGRSLPGMNADPRHAGTGERGFRQNQNLFTAKDAEDAKEEKSLALIHGTPGQVNADERHAGTGERGLGDGRKPVDLHPSKPKAGLPGTPVEWKPTPEMYRMDTPEGMEAYEASFRMKIRTSGDRVIGRSGDPTPARATAARSGGPGDRNSGECEHAKTHAILR